MCRVTPKRRGNRIWLRLDGSGEPLRRRDVGLKMVYDLLDGVVHAFVHPRCAYNFAMGRHDD